MPFSSLIAYLCNNSKFDDVALGNIAVDVSLQVNLSNGAMNLLLSSQTTS